MGSEQRVRRRRVGGWREAACRHLSLFPLMQARTGDIEPIHQGAVRGGRLLLRID